MFLHNIRVGPIGNSIHIVNVKMDSAAINLGDVGLDNELPLDCSNLSKKNYIMQLH